jgi:hypothetical protein
MIFLSERKNDAIDFKQRALSHSKVWKRGRERKTCKTSLSYLLDVNLIVCNRVAQNGS